MSLRALSANVAQIPATGASGNVPIPVMSESALLSAILAGADIFVNGSLVQPSNSGGQWFINGQPLCALFGTCPSSNIATPVPIVRTMPGPGVILTPSVTPSDTSGQAGAATYIQAATSAAIAPTLQPNQQGSTPTGGAGGSGSSYTTVPSNCLGPTIYRFILNNNGIFQTGANRGGCSSTNTGACDPQTFPSLQQAIAYALANGETPYQVFSANDPWEIMNCQLAINPAQIYNPDGSLGSGLFGGLSTTDILIGLGLAWFLFLRKKRS